MAQGRPVGGGGGFGAPPQQGGDPYASVFGGANNIILDIGRQNFETYVRKGESSFLNNYLPVVRDLRRYFRVDHAYVRRKLMVLLAPFFAAKIVGFPLWSAQPGQGGGPGGRSMSSGPAPIVNSGGVGGGYSFGDDVAAAQSPASSGFGSVGSAVGSPNGPHATAPQDLAPIEDIGALDLYIPSMALLTYVTLCGVVHGLAEDSLSPDYLASALWSVIAWLLLEAGVVKVACWSLQLPMKTLDAVALGGYKHAGVCVLVFLREFIAGAMGMYIYFLFVAYVAAAAVFFTFKTSGVLLAKRDDGRLGKIPGRAQPVHWGWSAVQALFVFWFAMRPL